MIFCFFSFVLDRKLAANRRTIRSRDFDSESEEKYNNSEKSSRIKAMIQSIPRCHTLLLLPCPLGINTNRSNPRAFGSFVFNDKWLRRDLGISFGLGRAELFKSELEALLGTFEICANFQIVRNFYNGKYFYGQYSFESFPKEKYVFL